jgi:hypothetical protein
LQKTANQIKTLKINDIKDALLTKGKITDDEFSSLRFLIKDVLGVKEFNNQMRNEIVNYITCERLERNSIIINPQSMRPIDVFIIAEGSVKLSVYYPEFDNFSDNIQLENKIIGREEVFKELF